MKNIEEFIEKDKKELAPILTAQLAAFFSEDEPMPIEKKRDMAFELFTAFPFEFMRHFHEWAFGDLYPEKDGAGHLAADREGHVARSGEAVRSFYDPANPKALEERVAYFKGISIVFPHMLMGIHHGWLFEGVPGAKNYQAFMEDHLPAMSAKYHPMMEEAYGSGSPEALRRVYTLIATEFPYEMIRDYYAWLNG